jgi:hypothetical protein
VAERFQTWVWARDAKGSYDQVHTKKGSTKSNGKIDCRKELEDVAERDLQQEVGPEAQIGTLLGDVAEMNWPQGKEKEAETDLQQEVGPEDQIDSSGTLLRDVAEMNRPQEKE